MTTPTTDQLLSITAQLPALEREGYSVREAGTHKLLAMVIGDSPLASDLTQFFVDAKVALPALALEMREARSDAAEWQRENAALRLMAAEVLTALGNGSFAGPNATLDFIRGIPDEVHTVVERLKSEQLSTMKRLTARIRELEQAMATAYAADPPRATSPDEPALRMGGLCRWCGLDGIVCDKKDVTCPRCKKSLFTGPSGATLPVTIIRPTDPTPKFQPPAPTHVVPGAVCRWCGQDGIQDYGKADMMCPRCNRSIFTGPQEHTRIPLDYKSARAMTPVPVERGQYHILQGDSADSLQAQVAYLRERGWRPVGGVCVTCQDALLKSEPVCRFYQAME